MVKLNKGLLGPTDELEELRQRNSELETMLVPLAKRTAKNEWLLEKKQAELDNYRLRKGMRLLDATVDFIKSPTQPVKYLRRALNSFRAVPKPEIPNRPLSVNKVINSPEIISRLESSSLSSRLLYPNLRIGFLGEFPFKSIARGLNLAQIDWRSELGIGIDLVIINRSKLSKNEESVLKELSSSDVNLVYWPVDNEYAATVDNQIYNPINWRREPKKNVVCMREAEPRILETEQDVLLSPLRKYLLFTGGIRYDKNLRDKRLAGATSEETINESKKYLAAVCLPSFFKDESGFIQRVLEFMAVGTPVITINNPALTKVVNKKYLLISSSSKQTKSIIKLLSDTEFRERHSILARRYVHLTYSKEAQLEKLLKQAKVPVRKPDKISILICTNRPTHLQQALKNVASQNYRNKELVLVLHGDNFDIPHIRKSLKSQKFPTKLINKPSSWLFGECLNAGLDETSGDYVTKMDDDDLYGPNHLIDLLVAHRYSGADIVGKWGNFVYLEGLNSTISWQVEREERFGSHLPGATIFMKREFLAHYRFGRVRRAIDSELFSRIIADGAQLYSTHRYNFVRIRHGAHTYQKDDKDFLARAGRVKKKGLIPEEFFI